MRRILIPLLTAIASFLAGVCITGLPEAISEAVVNSPPPQLKCSPHYEDKYRGSDYKGVLTGRLLEISGDGTLRFSDEEANDEETANFLRHFREIPLTAPESCADESYRFAWIPSFHRPTVIRIWRSGDKYLLTIKRLNGMGGYGLGDLDFERTRYLSPEEWHSFVDPVDRYFWQSPATIDEPVPNDGASWTIEGFKDGQFHSVFRLMPSGELRQIIESAFDLTGVKTEYQQYL